MNCVIDGVNIHYEMMGSGKEKILLLHGWGCSTDTMMPVAKAFEGDAQLLLVDFPAHGKSDNPPAPWGVPEFADCTHKLLEKLSFSPCHVIAHSFGCRVAIYLASHEETAGLFNRMVLTGAAGIKDRPTPEGQKRSARYKKLKAIGEKLAKIKPLAPFAEKYQEKLRKKYGSADYNALSPEMRKTFVKIVSQDLTEFLPYVKQPTLLIWGENDTATPLWMGKLMEEKISDAGLVVFDGRSHFAFLEEPGRFNIIARKFLLEE